MPNEEQTRKPYPTDLTDKQWALLEPMIPLPRTPHGGTPRRVDMREVINTLRYHNRTGCQWELLPHDLLPKSTVYEYFARWRDDGTWARMVDALRLRVRRKAGREPTPSAACIDSQSVKTTEVGGPERGYDGGKKVKGRKRHLLVEWAYSSHLRWVSAIQNLERAQALSEQAQSYEIPQCLAV